MPTPGSRYNANNHINPFPFQSSKRVCRFSPLPDLLAIPSLILYNDTNETPTHPYYLHYNFPLYSFSRQPHKMTQPDILQSPEAIFWRNALLIVCFGAGGLATFAVMLRIYACRAYAGKIRAEDTLMIVSVLMMWGSTAGALLKAYNGIGIDADKLPDAYNTRLAVGSWIIPKFWSISMACAKISIIIFINRAVQLSRRVNAALFVVALSVYAYTGVVFFFTIFMCQPISFYWDKTKPNGTCVSNESYMIQNIATAIAALVTDLGILIIPMPTILSLKLEARKKAAVVGVFGVGIL